MHVETIKFSNYTVLDGLSDNYCESVIQDSYGFIWVATNDGLCRYDGYTFKIYKYNEHDTLTIGNNYLFRVFEDSDSTLWVATNMGGLAKYNREEDCFQRITFNADGEIWHQRNRINDIAESGNFLWLCTMYGLGKFNKKTEEVKWYLPDIQNNSKNLFHQITCADSDKDGNLWVGSLFGGLLYFDVKAEKFTKQYVFDPTDKNSLSNDRIKRILYTEDNKLWVCTEEGGLNLLNPNTEQFIRYTHNISDPKSIGSNDVYNIYLDSKKRLWFGTINGGLNLFNKKDSSFTKFLPAKDYSRSINCPSVSSIAEDSFGNIWMTTHGGGLNQINPRENNMPHLHEELSICKNLRHNYISCFYEDSVGNVWIGTDGGGFHKFDPTTFKIEAITPINGLRSNAILDICGESRNKLWIATWAGGVSLYNKETNTIEKTYFITDQTNTVGANNVKSVFNTDSLVWLSTHGDGIHIIDKRTGELLDWKSESPLPFDLRTAEWGNEVLIDKHKRTWITTNIGLYMFDGTTLQEMIEEKDDSCSINGYIVISIFEDTNNRIWVGTDDGLNLYDEQNSCFKWIKNSPNKIKAIVEDDNGDLWLSSNKGLTKYCIKKNSFEKFTMLDGLQGYQFFERSCIKLSSGYIMFGGLNGFNIFHPDSIKQKSYPTHVIFTTLHVQNFENKSESLHKPIMFENEVSLKYGQTVVTIEYTGIGLTAPSRNRYKFMLEGFDKDWRSETAERKATYTNLDPGTYVFKVIATNSKGEWVEKPIAITIHVLPPWWMKIEYRIVIILCILIITFLLYRYRVYQIKQQNKLLEREVSIRTKELHSANCELQIQSDEINKQNGELLNAKNEIEHQNNLLEKQKNELEEKNIELNELIKTKDKFMSIIAHDIKNPLNSLIGFSELTYNNFRKYDEAKLSKFLQLISTSSKQLYNLVNNLLEWALSQTDAMQPIPEKINIRDLIEQNVGLVRVMSDSKFISIKTGIIHDGTIWADASMANTILRNLLNNAIKFTPEQGIIRVYTNNIINGYISICVEDNGIGMSQKMVNGLFKIDIKSSTKGTNKEQGTGLGLLLCKEFVNKNNGTITVQSSEGKGSTFTVTLPLLDER